MGYCMEQRDCRFRIPADKKAGALAAVKALANTPERMSGGSWHGGKHTESWYSWVSTEEFVNAGTLEDAVKAWRWELETDPKSGNVISIWFMREKLGDDAILFEALAPFVEDGSYIEMEGEDDELWRWVFEGGKVREIRGHVTVTWDE